ncbi:hypothetical protein [Streptomyces sp. NBC_01800]|uniref:hypothetical protein n=1 Tax=Streptomyces sp. NBC_01800 TaxID=2975945 RepID=UPI002DD945D4|nr:hypothetical protein [Streptomyces sp. NBC_01800]WSA70369.1 hypothetical protein OIE65_27280 [Streptomyces sp. NBC_01800]
MKRTPAAVAVAVLMATGVSACTSSDGTTREQPRSDGSPTAARTGKGNVPVTESRPRPCKGGTYTWFDTRRRWVLNGVTEPQHLTAAKGTKFTKPMRRLRTDMASVRTDGADGTSPDNDAVLLALGVHLGPAEKGDETSGLGEPGEYAPVDNAGGEFSGAAGHLVEFSSVQLIETDFRRSCGPGKQREQSVGHVVNWTSSGGGDIRCETPLTKHASAAAREAVRLSCHW